MSVALRCRGLPRNGCRPWGDDDRSLGMTFGDGISNELAILRAVCRETLNASIALIESKDQRAPRLTGEGRFPRLTAPLAGSRGMPGRHSFFGDPYCEASPPDQRRIVFRPICHPVPSHRDLVAPALVELVRHGV